MVVVGGGAGGEVVDGVEAGVVDVAEETAVEVGEDMVEVGVTVL
jgi:hypothetical protein